MIKHVRFLLISFFGLLSSSCIEEQRTEFDVLKRCKGKACGFELVPKDKVYRDMIIKQTLLSSKEYPNSEVQFDISWEGLIGGYFPNTTGFNNWHCPPNGQCTSTSNPTAYIFSDSTESADLYVGGTATISGKPYVVNKNFYVTFEDIGDIYISSNCIELECTYSIDENPSSGAEPYEYHWFEGDDRVNSLGVTYSNDSNECSLTYTYKNSGEKSVQAVLIDNNNNVETSNVVSNKIGNMVNPEITNECKGLSCIFNSDVKDSSYTYTWYINGQTLSSGNNSYFTYNYPKDISKDIVYLTITDQNGTSVESNSLEITATSSLSTPQISEVRTIQNEEDPKIEVSIDRPVIGGAPPYTYQFYKNGSKIDDSDIEQVNNKTSKLTYIISFDPEDVGYNQSITDKAKDSQNNISQESNQILFTPETVLGKPSTFISAQENNNYEFSVSYKNLGGTPPYKYNWQIKDSGNHLVEIYDEDEDATLIHKFENTGKYEVTLSFEDSKGYKSDASEPLFVDVNGTVSVLPPPEITDYENIQGEFNSTIKATIIYKSFKLEYQVFDELV